MIKEYLHINKILDLTKWKRLQDSLATVTKLAILTVDYKGIPVTSHSSCQAFCQSVRKDPELLPYCQKCDSRGGLEAVRLNEPYVYLCHFNIVDIAIPITIDGKYIGAVMAGQVKLADPEKGTDLEQIVTSKNVPMHAEKLKELQEEYDQLPVMTYEEVVKISNMLSLLCNYIVEEALNKNLLVEMFEKASGNQQSLNLATILPGYSIRNIESIKKEMTNAIADAYLKTSPNEAETANPVLQPAFEYIYGHKSEQVSLKHMAELCHLSPSYFSRLFAKETGENFTTYLAKLKIKWAKQLLEITDMPVSQISDELGFNESGYFIKIFKKFEEITPALYRKYIQKQ
ncbi:ligand-binding sensor protein/AraC-like DNA-binding protein [Paenibacillus amylolyticus]|uniref:Ligand-binding sensor protein/AraC-like DNA-binding protein n=1 Tax=Paenibacillus amylolyticus TaxID=1451 RepID=A0AAP5H5Q6_PAEAM|nr:PocR ligand-binding domain-containing protein [Paenibacillus amylolyticus]MDR6725710.1 ligand-binding sensor protein/AraC-like DNA-binding protein [Paenibacillus amylolyticus]